MLSSIWLCLLSVSPATLALSAGEVLREYTWQQRPLLVFAPAPEHPLLREQQRILEPYQAGLEERQVLVIHIVDQGLVSLAGRPDISQASDWQQRFGLDGHQFQVLLLGKDGGVKLRQDHPVSAAALFRLIDSMPMRQQEMRAGGH